MEFVVRALLYFTCLCLGDFVFCDEYAEIGGWITFSPGIRGKPVEILWKHNGDKVAEYDSSEMEEFGSFKDRVVIDFETGQLTIKKLTSQDGGQYQSDIMINGKVQSSRHTLTVLDVLPDPRVTCKVNETSNLQELLCSVDYKTPLQYKWSGPNVIDHPGAKLILDEQQKNSDSVYSCTVKNEASRKTADFNRRDCVTGAAGAAGAAAARLEVILPVVVIMLLIILIMLAIIIYRKRKSRRSEQKRKDPEHGSPEDTLPSQRTFNHHQDKKEQDEVNGSDNTGENEEKAKLLNHRGNEEELENDEHSPHADVVGENTSSRPEESQTEMQEQRLPGRQDEEEEGQGEELEKGKEMERRETPLDHLMENRSDPRINDADNKDKILGEKKEEGNKEEGNKEGGNKEEGNKEEGSKEEGNTDEGNKEGGNKEEGRKEERNKEGGNNEEGNKEGGNKEEGNTDEGNKEGGNTEGGNKEGGNKEGANKEGGNKDEGNKEGGNKEGGNKEERNKDEGNKEARNKEEKDQQSTGSSDASVPNQTTLMDQGDSDKQDKDSRSDHTNEEKPQNHRGNEEELKNDGLSPHGHKGKSSVDELTEGLGNLNINDVEGNKEEKNQQSTELSGVLQDSVTQEICTAQSSQHSQNNEEENPSPEENSEAVGTSAQKQNEGEQTTGANTMKETHTGGLSPQSEGRRVNTEAGTHPPPLPSPPNEEQPN